MRFLFFTLLIMLATPALAQATETAATTQPLSNTLVAIRKVQVTGDPVKSVDNYITHIASDLSMQILEAANTDLWRNALHTSHDGNYYTFEVKLDAGFRPAAKEFVDTLIARAQQEMQQDFEERRTSQTNFRESQVARLHDERVKTQSMIEAMRQQLHETTGRLDVTPNNLRVAMTKLQDERQQLELDLRGKQARGEAIANAIAELTKEAEAKNKSDDVLVELQKVVDAREKQLDLMKKNFASGLNTSVEVEQVAAQAAEARAKVAERKRDAQASAGGEALAALNRELRMLSIDRAEQEARFKLVSQQLEQIGGEVNAIDKYDQLLASFPKLAERDDESQSNYKEILARLEQSVRPGLKITYARDWTEKELRIPTTDPTAPAHPATKD
jgi:hypothetical protein